MIQATAAKMIQSRAGVKKLSRTKYPKSAPIGSATPPAKEIQKALDLLFVAKYMGAATAIPSGML